MRSVPLALPAVVVSALLLAACGSEQAGSSGGGPAQTPVPPGASACGAKPAGATAEPTTSAPPEDRAEWEKSGVRITAMPASGPICADFQVTNSAAERVTFTVSFAFIADSGEAFANPVRTLPSVRPGQTVKRTVTADERRSGARDQVRVKIARVRSVPTDEAPSRAGTCPSSGTRLYADEDADAAMGLRVLGISLENCGSRVTRLNGYPRLQLLDESHKPVPSVKVLHGSSAITTGPTGAEGKAQPLTLKPGERARSYLVWRNTVEAVEEEANINSPYVRVWAKRGAAPVMLTPELDLGTTGKLGVGPWKKG